MTIACVGSTAGFQPQMVPSSVSKIRRAGAAPWNQGRRRDMAMIREQGAHQTGVPVHPLQLGAGRHGRFVSGFASGALPTRSVAPALQSRAG